MESYVVDRATVANILAEQLKLPPNTSIAAPSDPVVAEYLRATLYALTYGGGKPRPVYVTTLTNRVRAQLGALWPGLSRLRNQRPSQQEQRQEGDTAPDRLRRVLQALSDLREAIHVGQGYWLPGPVRLVQLPGDQVLAIGGVSTAMLRQMLPQVKIDWIARRVTHDGIPIEVQDDVDKWQDRESWLGTPPASLEAWLEEYIRRAEKELGQSASDVTDFEIYDPARERGEVQAFRWVDAQQYTVRPDGLVLCRSRGGGYMTPRRFWFGAVRGSRDGWRIDREAHVEARDVRRLQYGLDHRAGTPTSVAVQLRKSHVVLTLRNLLPPEERRLLIAFAEDRSAEPGRFPLQYIVGLDVYPALQRSFTALGVKLSIQS